MIISSTNVVITELVALQRAFAKELPDRMRAIGELWGDLQQQSGNDKLVDELYRKVHNLAGAGGTFGVMPVTHTARELEQAVKALKSTKATDLVEQFPAVQQQIDRLREVAESWKPSSVPYLAESKRNKDYSGKFNNLIYLIDDDLTLAPILCEMLEKYGYHPVYFNNTRDFERQWSTLEQPGAIIMDMVFNEGTVAGAETIKALRDKWGYLAPVIFVSVRDDFESRYAATQAGANRYFLKPLNYENLCETLDGLTGRLVKNPYRVLIIDDDQSVLEFYSSLLRKEEIEVQTSTEPLKALSMIAEFQPDLMILDVYMPGCTGLELATVIRQDDGYAQMPIVFLSSESDFEKHLAAIDLGGDEFLNKSISPENFIVAISARLKRARWSTRVNQQLRDALKQSEYQRIALDMHGIVSIINPEGLIIHTNDKYCELSGYTLDELMGSYKSMLKSEIHSDEFISDIWATISEGDIWNGEFCNLNKSGNEYWIDSTIVPFLDEQKKPYQYVCIGTNITPIKIIQEDLVLAKKQAEAANEAKSQFLTNMSHELRTPLNAVMGFAQILQMSTKPPLIKNHEEYVDRIEKASGHLLKLINEMLDLAAIDSGSIDLAIQPVSLVSVIEESCQLIEPSLSRYEVTLKYERALFDNKSVIADPTRLKQVLLNLLSNACKYNKPKGSIHLDCQSLNDNFLRIGVTDTGHGIEQAQQVELFKPFSRLGAESTEIEGSGIGLAYSKKLIELMKGRIGFDSQLGQGSTFWIEMPKVQESDEL